MSAFNRCKRGCSSGNLCWWTFSPDQSTRDVTTTIFPGITKKDVRKTLISLCIDIICLLQLLYSINLTPGCFVATRLKS